MEKTIVHDKCEDALFESKNSACNSNRAEIGAKKKNKKSMKEESLRKLSVLSRELSQISARQKGIRENLSHLHLPLNSNKNSKEVDQMTKNS